MQKRYLNAFFKYNGILCIPLYVLFLLINYHLYVDNISFLAHSHFAVVLLLYALVIVQFCMLFHQQKQRLLLFSLLLFIPIMIPYDLNHQLASFIHILCGYGAVFILNLLLLYHYYPNHIKGLIMIITLVAGLHIMICGCVTGFAELFYLSGISVVTTAHKFGLI